MELGTLNLKRNPARVKKAMVKTKSDIIIKEACSVVFPTRYLKRGLATIESEVVLFGVFAVVMEDGSYSVANIPSFVRLSPWNISEEDYGGVSYTVLDFEANTTFITNVNVVKSESFAYDYFDEFIIKAKVPFYLSYEDMVRTTLLAKKYAGSGIGDSSSIMEIINAIISRVPEDKRKSVRHAINEGKKIETPARVPLESAYYTFDNTLNRVLGSYSDKGITASLVEETEEAGRIEKLLRA